MRIFPMLSHVPKYRVITWNCKKGEIKEISWVGSTNGSLSDYWEKTDSALDKNWMPTDFMYFIPLKITSKYHLDM